MQKKKPVFSPEGISINEQLQALHELYKQYRVYRQQALVTFTWTEEPSHGPQFLRALFKQTRQLMGVYNIHPVSSSATYGPSQAIFVDDDTEDGPTIGAIAFYNSKTKGYEAFSFDRAKMKDLRRVNIIVEDALAKAEKWKGLKLPYSTAEYSAKIWDEKSREARDTPH